MIFPCRIRGCLYEVQALRRRFGRVALHRCCRTEGNCRSLALPNFLLISVALIEYMRFLLRKTARVTVSRNCPAGNSAALRGHVTKLRLAAHLKITLVGSKGPDVLFLLSSVMTQTHLR